MWVRTIVSNAVSLPVDSVLFVGLAFVALPVVFGATPISFADAGARLVEGQIIVKALTVLILTPILYLAPYNREADPTAG